VSSMHVEGENPLSPNLKGLEVRRLGTLWAEDTRCLLLCPIGWGPRGVDPSESGNHDHRSTPGKPLGLVWCNSLLSLVLFR
jgi:hypothetical protein